MRTSFRLLAALPFAALVAIASPSVAHADDNKDCAPGSWFCGETQPPSKDLQPLPPADEKPATARPSTPPPVVVYQPPPTVVVQPREAPPPYYYVPRGTPARRTEFGLNLHVGGLLMGRGQDNNAGMGMIGFGLRYRPVPAFAVEADLDFAGGRDYNGFRRNETGLTFNGLVFVNPKSKTQLYFVGGFGWSGAKAVDDRSGRDDVEYHYGYFGVLGGVGLEFRLSRMVALNVDLRGFVRGRVDDNRHNYYEFTDSQGRHTNTSGGGSLNGGLTFYW